MANRSASYYIARKLLITSMSDAAQFADAGFDTLPSSSPANAQLWFDQKPTQWKNIIL